MLITIAFIVLSIAVIWALAYHAVSGRSWTIGLATLLLAGAVTQALPVPLLAVLAVAIIVFGCIANITGLRQKILTAPIFKLYKKILPQMSQTEHDALMRARCGGMVICFRVSLIGINCSIIQPQN